ncbi:MAG: FMN-binding glutamate synthase family protein [Candidatus Cloacimonadota bacterium]|nr:MAG: FMN-binding glutamate synthase family protein [Candidatus Cloacimonadota bacterium]
MSFSKLNATAATLTKNRTEGSIVPISGMCVTCVDGCIGMCEIGKSAYRGHEVIYPQPFGIITTASEKDYPVDLSHFTILGGVVGAQGIEADSDKAIFPNVNLERTLCPNAPFKVKLPFVIPGLGSTKIAKINWEGLAVGAALAGFPLTIGENVVAMDPESEIKNGKIMKAPDLQWRIKLYKKWQQDGYGDIIVQANVEDTRLGVQEFAIEKLGVETVELKWGQGAKNIGGEVKFKDLEKAQLLYKRGYVVLPNPTDPSVIEAFKRGAFKEFERHSRIGMADEEAFIKRVEELRKAGAKRVTLKTGAYRPQALAQAMKWSSKARVDMLTVDGAGGGTGMSPWRMMNEWGVPTIELWSLTRQYAEKLIKKGEHLPDLVFAGGCILEDQIFKALSMGAPYVKLVGMARSFLAAAMVGKTIGKRINEGQVPVYIERFGTNKEDIFITASDLKKQFGKDFDNIPTGALGVYTYAHRLAQGLRQLMTGARKFNLDLMVRDDLAALTHEAADISGLKYIMDVDKEEAEKILND